MEHYQQPTRGKIGGLAFRPLRNAKVMFDPLDPRQVRRIESVHRGFLYQHLYTAGCLILAGRGEIRSITVEMDEDVELERDDGNRLYAQIKTRASPLILSDIADALERFERIRLEHREGRRTGEPSFAIVANVAPGPELLARIAGRQFPDDLQLLWPGATATMPVGLPPVWPDLSTAVTWCANQAAGLPMAMLEPETLVWKLAGRVLLAATGEAPGHTFHTVELNALFEQLVVQLQQFPAPPEAYRPLEDEPALVGADRILTACAD